MTTTDRLVHDERRRLIAAGVTPAIADTLAPLGARTRVHLRHRAVAARASMRPVVAVVPPGADVAPMPTVLLHHGADAQLYALLARVAEIGRHRGTWTLADLQRVAATLHASGPAVRTG